MTEKTSVVAAPMSGQELLARDTGYTQEQLDLMKRTVCDPDMSNDEFALFANVAKRSRLDPFKKQIYAIMRWDSRAGRKVMKIQGSIDGFRATAARNEGKYLGQTPVFWCGPDGAWVDVWLKPEPPAAAKTGIHLKDAPEPIWAVARWDSYVQTDKNGKATKFWMNMPDLMLGKCAESLALRKAFPEDLSGIYTAEEMDQADTHHQIGPGQAPNEREAVSRIDALRERLRSKESPGLPVPTAEPESGDGAPLFAQPNADPIDKDEPGVLADWEIEPRLKPEYDEGSLDQFRTWKNSPGPWGSWANEPMAEKGKLAKWTAEQMLHGPEGGGRHTIAKNIIEKTAAKYGNETVPQGALRLDYVLAVMERYYAWLRIPAAGREAEASA